MQLLSTSSDSVLGTHALLPPPVLTLFLLSYIQLSVTHQPPSAFATLIILQLFLSKTISTPLHNSLTCLYHSLSLCAPILSSMLSYCLFPTSFIQSLHTLPPSIASFIHISVSQPHAHHFSLLLFHLQTLSSSNIHSLPFCLPFSNFSLSILVLHLFPSSITLSLLPNSP
jgi:hypothetical protein